MVKVRGYVVENLQNSDSLEMSAQALASICSAFADVHYLSAVDSTNTWLKEQYEAGAVTRPALVITDAQTAGRGTRGRDWLQAGQDIALSCGAIVDVNDEIDQRLSLAVGAIVAEGIEKVTGLAARVKWPNDVLTRRHDDKDPENWLKVSGTLIETILGTEQRLIVIGVGVNVNSTTDDYPAELAGRLITLRDALDKPARRSALATHLSLPLLNLMILLSGPLKKGSPLDTNIDHLVADWFTRDVTAGTSYLLNREGNTIPVTASHVDRQTCGLVCRDDQEREYLVTSYTELAPAEDR